MTPRMNTLISLSNSLPLASTSASRVRGFASLALAACAFLGHAVAATAARTDAKSATMTEPPPLDSKIVEMMKTNVVGSVEAKIFFVEKWDITPVQKSQVLFSMLDSTEGDDQRKLAHAAVQFVATANYGLVRKHLLDAKIPRVVLSVFMTDTLKRDYQTKLPVILELAQNEGHPMRAEAQQLLRGYLNCDHGTNWSKWEEAMLSYLATNPR